MKKYMGGGGGCGGGCSFDFSILVCWLKVKSPNIFIYRGNIVFCRMVTGLRVFITNVTERFFFLYFSYFFFISGTYVGNVLSHRVKCCWQNWRLLLSAGVAKIKNHKRINLRNWIFGGFASSQNLCNSCQVFS